MKRVVFLACLTIAVAACDDDRGGGGWVPSVVFSEEQRELADQIISVFENNTPQVDYAYAENLDDGRGITAGRAGFTSATGDLLEVVQRYTDAVPDNPLADYLPRLRELAAEESDSVAGLEGLEDAWATAAGDPLFREVQDEVVDDEYYWPAVAHADDLGLTFPLSLLNLYDTCIQHGDGDDPDGLPAIIARTSAQAGGTPMDGTDEHVWLEAFMQIRRAVLLDPHDPDTRDVWAESVGRVDALMAIFASGNVTLTPPIAINPFGTPFVLPQ
jgi:chitosanase